MRASLLAFIAVLSACGAVKDSNPTPDAPVIVEATLTSIAVTPATAMLKRRLSPPEQLKATGTYSDSTTADITTMVTWTSSDMTMAMVTPGGLASTSGATAVGDVTVTATLDGKSGAAQLTVLDPTLVVANYTGQRIDFFASPFVEGNVAPLRTITGALALLQGPWSIAVNQNEVYAAQANGAAINVYPATGNGNIAPTRRITGAATLLQTPCGVAVVAEEVFVATQNNRVLVFNRTDTGDVAPKREITGTLTLMATPIQLAVHNGEIFVANNGGAITVYPATGTGNIAPTRRIAGGATMLGNITGIGIRNNEIYVTSASQSQINVFPIDATGDVPPSRIITGSMNYASAFALLANEIIVPNFLGQTVVTHNIGASTAATPIRTLSGALTGISGPMGIAVY